jgi:Protein of unknown function (DUF3710)
VFKRRREADVPPEDPAAAGVDADDVSAEGDAEEAPPESSGPAPRVNGPWDESEDAPDLPRLDLGSMRVAGRPGMEVRVDLDQPGGAVISATCVLREGALQLQPYAAPKSSGIWEEVRAELVEGIAAGGGTAEELDGPFGPEVLAMLDVDVAPGKKARQQVRFAGVDGPRWFLRAVFTGAAVTDDGVRADLEEVLRGVVVVRGGDPRSPRELLPLRLPQQEEAPAAEGGRPPLEPFSRGPEITEIR